MDEPAPGLRASDADRERVAFVLQTAMSEGRLSLDEFDQRVADAYAARTYGDLAALTEDLPTSGSGLGRADLDPARHRPPAFRKTPPVRRGTSRSAWSAYLSVNLICLVVWAALLIGPAGAQGLWFLWVAGPWGAVLAGREITARLR